MTTEERVLKLENAFSTLAQLAASQDERTSALTQLAARQDERTSALAQIAARQDARTSALAQIAARQDARTADTEQSIRLLLEIAQTQSSRIDDGDERQRQTDAHLDVLGLRMTEVATAQAELATAQAELATAQAELATAQARTERTVEQLGQALTKLTARVDHLSETVERYITGGA